MRISANESSAKEESCAYFRDRARFSAAFGAPMMRRNRRRTEKEKRRLKKRSSVRAVAIRDARDFSSPLFLASYRRDSPISPAIFGYDGLSRDRTAREPEIECVPPPAGK